MTAREVPVFVFWIEDEWGRTGGGPQPAGWDWPADVPLPLVGDELAAPAGASPLGGRGRVRVLSRRWELSSVEPRLVLVLDCEWAS